MTENEQAHTFEGDEAEVRAALQAMKLIYSDDAWPDQALALLDAKDAEIAELKLTQYRDTRAEQAEAEAERLKVKCAQLTDRSEFDKGDIRILRAKVERAEAALAEERKAHQAFREKVSQTVHHWNGGGSVDWGRFILPAKPKPCTCFPGEAPEPCQQKYALTDCLRAAIERAGGVKAVFGEG